MRAMIGESDPFFKIVKFPLEISPPLLSRRKHPSQTVAVIYRYWRKDAKTGGAGNSNHLLFNAKMHVIEKRGSQCTSNTSSQISINSVCDNNTYYLKDLPFLWKTHFFLDEPKGKGGRRQDFQGEFNNFEKKGSNSPIIARIVMSLIPWWVINFAVCLHVQFSSKASNLPSLGHGTLSYSQG